MVSTFDVALSGATYVSVSASGFVLSVFIVWALLAFITPKKRKRQRDVGDFGKFMVMLEAIGT